jgi:hypothetical protein
MLAAGARSGESIVSSIYGGSRGWNDLNDVVQPVARLRTSVSADAAAVTPPDTDWSKVRRAQPADYLLAPSQKWFDALPLDKMPCALASQFPRIINMIVIHWNDRRTAPALFEELLGDRRGGRAGFPPAVRRDLLRLQEYWYSGALNAP